MPISHLITILVLLAAGLLPAPAHAGGVVTVCDEAHLLAALAGGGTVTFACSGVITLTNTITIAADTIIDGSGQTVTLSGNSEMRAFYVSSGTALQLNQVTITRQGSGWSHGGGIRNDGMLTVSNSTLSGNGAVQGGGIHNDGTLTVSNSTFDGNHATTGGGIYSSDGTVIVSNSTFSSNASEEGGGIFNSSGAVTVSNSTFSRNIGIDWGGGGIFNSGGAVTISNSTFSGNGFYGAGGIHNHAGTVKLENTIVAGPGWGCSGAIIDGAGNLSYPDASCPGINANPLLGPLQDNGGPTWTMALGPGSAAIDAGDDAICAAPPVNNRDQRGVVRPQGAHCDSGALEQLRRWLPVLVVTSSP